MGVRVADFDARLARPGEQRRGLRRDLGRAFDCAFEHLAGATVDRDDVAGAEHPAVDPDLAVADDDTLSADDGGDAPAAGNDRGVTGEPAARREDACGTGHAVNVVGRCLARERGSPACRPPADATAASGSVTIGPLATPGDAASPVVSAEASEARPVDDPRRIRQQRQDAPDRLTARQREVCVLAPCRPRSAARPVATACRPAPGAATACRPRS